MAAKSVSQQWFDDHYTTKFQSQVHRELIGRMGFNSRWDEALTSYQIKCLSRDRLRSSIEGGHKITPKKFCDFVERSAISDNNTSAQDALMRTVIGAKTRQEVKKETSLAPSHSNPAEVAFRSLDETEVSDNGFDVVDEGIDPMSILDNPRYYNAVLRFLEDRATRAGTGRHNPSIIRGLAENESSAYTAADCGISESRLRSLKTTISKTLRSLGAEHTQCYRALLAISEGNLDWYVNADHTEEEAADAEQRAAQIVSDLQRYNLIRITGICKIELTTSGQKAIRVGLAPHDLTDVLPLRPFWEK